MNIKKPHSVAYILFGIFFVVLSYVISFIVLPIKNIDHQEIDSISAALSGRDEPYYPVIGYFVLGRFLSYSSEKTEILRLSFFIFSIFLFIAILILDKILIKNIYLTIISTILLVTNLSFINNFFRILSFSFPISTIINIFGIIFFIRLFTARTRNNKITFGILFIITQVLGIYTSSYFILSTITLFAVGIIYSNNIKKDLIKFFIIFLFVTLLSARSLSKITKYLMERNSSYVFHENISTLFSSFSELTPYFLTIILIFILISIKHKLINSRIHKQQRLEKSKKIFITYSIGLISIFVITRIFFNFNIVKISSFLAPLIYLVSILVTFILLKQNYKNNRVIITILIVLTVVSLFYNLIQISNKIEYDNQYQVFKENVINEISNNVLLNETILLPYHILYEYIGILEINYIELIDKNNETVFKEIFDGKNYVMKSNKIELDNISFRLLPENINQESQIWDYNNNEFYLVLKDYPEYKFTKDFISKNCFLLDVHHENKFYKCTTKTQMRIQ